MMEYSSTNFRRVQKQDLINNLLKGVFTSLTKKERKELQEVITKSVEQGDYLTARNAFILGIYFDAEETFSNIRKKGIFRYSNYISKKCILSELANELLEICNLLKYNSEVNIKYLTSIVNMSGLHDSYNILQNSIIDEIKSFRKKYRGRSLIKSLLSYIDFLFLSNHYPESITDPSEISSRTKEDICSAISYLIYFISEHVSFKTDNITFVSEEYIRSGDINRIIIDACLLMDFKEFEILIEHFNYECILEGNLIRIKPKNEDFEKSIKLGYIRTYIQGINDVFNVEDALSLDELVDDINRNNRFDFFKFTEDQNYPRYIVKIPEPIYEYIVNKFFKTDLLFKEEVIYISHILKEQLLNYEDIKNIKIKDDLSLMEFIKIKRVFYLFFLLFTKQIYNKEKVNSTLLLRSLIPMYTEEALYQFIEKLTPNNNITSFLELVSWKPKMKKLFDLQYHPILFLENHFLTPLTILVNSNSIRNLFASEYKQNNKNLFTDGLTDALVEKLNKSFSKANIKSYKQTKISGSEIDLFAVYDNTLFIFECKHSLHPVSIFDLRTTYDYIKKAEKQLDYFNEEFKNGNLTKILESKHKIDLNKITHVVSCIILSNRLFNGNTFRYPIRNINEVENILERGTILTDEGEFWLWEKDALSLPDLLEYFSLENRLGKLLFDSLSVRVLNYRTKKISINFDYYYMDPKIAIPKLNNFTSLLRKTQ